ncbi:CPBP family intramembrane glutamic endopeptidase [Brachybacterium hainanense]|uniref:Lysostaphin resistance A-like protein n=1 Tax=Brachybacterium hainanense TaxID=1541174 RepID=A0ABV6RBJ1_9MICO
MTTHPVPSPLPGPAPSDAALRRAAAVIPGRPFGAHLRMSWWRPLVILPVLAIAMFGVQIVLLMIVVLLEYALTGRDPADPSMTPLMLLATNLSLLVLAPLALLLLVLVGGAPWRSALRLGRTFSWRRLGSLLLVFGVLIGAVYAVTSMIWPLGTTPVITATTVALIAVALLSTPLQAAAEEVVFRGVITAAIASWVRPARIAIVLGITVSSVLFGLAHGAGDPWLIAYYVTFGLSMALMALISRGLEAPIAFHVMNNVISMVIGAVSAGGGGLVIDRSAGAGGPFMLVFIALDLVAVAIVWLLERRRATRLDG